MAQIWDNRDAQGTYRENSAADQTANVDVIARLQQIRQCLNDSLFGLDVNQAASEMASVPSSSAASSCESDSVSTSSVLDRLGDLSSFLSEYSDLTSNAAAPSVDSASVASALEPFMSAQSTEPSGLSASKPETIPSSVLAAKIPLPREISLCDVFTEEPEASEESVPATAVFSEPAVESVADSQGTLASSLTSTMASVLQTASAASSNPFTQLLGTSESAQPEVSHMEAKPAVETPSAAKLWGQDFQYFAAAGIASGSVLLGLGYCDASTVAAVWHLGISLLIAGSVSLFSAATCLAIEKHEKRA